MLRFIPRAALAVAASLSLVGGTIAQTSTAVAQSSGACAGRAMPLEVVVRSNNFEIEESVVISQPSVTTTTYNVNGVEGLVLVVRTDSGGTTESLQAPQWLLTAYNGNLDAIRADVKSGILKDRIPCPSV